MTLVEHRKKCETVLLGIPWRSTEAWCCSRRWWLCQTEKWWTWVARWSRAPCTQEACSQYLEDGRETEWSSYDVCALADRTAFCTRTQIWIYLPEWNTLRELRKDQWDDSFRGNSQRCAKTYLSSGSWPPPLRYKRPRSFHTCSQKTLWTCRCCPWWGQRWWHSVYGNAPTQWTSPADTHSEVTTN